MRIIATYNIATSQVCVKAHLYLRPILLLAATKLGQGNVFTGVCHSVHRGEGVCLSACWDARPPRPGTPPQTRHTPQDQAHPPPPPQNRHPPRPGTPPQTRHTTPPDQAHSPPPGSRRQHTVNERPLRILLECILV